MKWFVRAMVAVGAVVPGVVDAHGGSGVVVLQAKDADELNRMLSIAMTAMLSGQKVSMWLVGCAPVPWFPAAPLATSIGFGR